MKAAAALVVPMAVALVAALSGGCSDRQSSAQPPRAAAPAVPAGVATAEQKDVPVQIIAVGNVQSIATVGVKSQIAGQILEVHFREGQDVARGALLFTIDPRPLEAAVRQAQANLARDTAALRQAEAAHAQRQAEVTQARANLDRDVAQLDNARVQEQRYRALVDRELIAREQYDQVRTTLVALQATAQASRAALENTQASVRAAEANQETARASIRANEAMVEAAQVQLGYTTIRAPMAGRTGNLLVQAGNVLKSNEDGPLVVIAQLRPIYVSFTVPEQHVGDIARYRAAGTLTVEATPAGTNRPATGTLSFVNNSVDTTTGSIQLKATFPNADDALWPGQFVDVALTLTRAPAVTVPTRAVQAGQQGPFVFVVKPDLTVESRRVRVGRRLPTELVIEEGVRAGERVVTDGQLRLVPGARIEVKPARPS